MQQTIRALMVPVNEVYFVEKVFLKGSSFFDEIEKLSCCNGGIFFGG